MKLSSLALALSLAIGSAPALSAGGPLDLSSGSAGFSSTPVAGGFVDLWTFTLAMTSTATASVTSAVNGAQDVDFSFISVAGPSGVLGFSQVLGDPYGPRPRAVNASSERHVTARQGAPCLASH